MSRLLIPNTCQVPNVIFDRIMPGLGLVALKVLMVIIRQTYGFNVASRQIGLDRLCKLSGLSRQGVVDGTKELGNLLVVKRGPINSRVANEYALNIDVSTGELVNQIDQSVILTSQQNTVGLVNKVDSLKPSLKPNKSIGAEAPEFSPLRSKRKLTRPDPAALAAFELFYSAYPKHVGKAEALKVWTKLAPSPETVAAIMAGVERYAESVADTDPKYIKHPGPWLNVRRWEDEPLSNGHAKPAQVKDMGDGMVEVEGRRMDRQTAERRYGPIAI